MNQTVDRMMPPILLHPDDDVAVVVQDVAPGTVLTVSGRAVNATDAIPSGHKVALRAVAAGAPVRKYGDVIGYATRPIAPGDHVHLHNLGYRPVESVATSSRSRARRHRARWHSARFRASAVATARSARAT